MRKRRLAAELRRLRKESGLTREQVAERVGCAPITITRIETGQSGARLGEVALMLETYGVTGDRREALMQVARDARKRGWWHPHTKAIPEWFQTYIGIEEEASSLRIYEAEVVPGLLQTEAYATATYLAEPVLLEKDEIARRVALRMERQRRLLEANDAPSMWVVLSEAVLRRHVGGKAVMREQLQYLDTLSRRPNVMLQVLPFSAGAHPAMQGGFTILSFPEPEDPDVVYVEYRLGSIYLEGHEEVDSYALLYNHLCAQALSRDGTRDLIAQVVDDMREP
ncbi:helix-turn-helix transcriptional regulator [Thermomonospora sp. CIF 1]|uniref:helix-turn-helix domain-containing protein n=1 Tax=Thermomonospora sp. CIF 1 TaxID=1916083 RepID=UPI00257E6D57|nr:helix-turn-helix transcriptional regulator [Thermomonospora sp. CIF 1]